MTNIITVGAIVLGRTVSSHNASRAAVSDRGNSFLSTIAYKDKRPLTTTHPFLF